MKRQTHELSRCEASVPKQVEGEAQHARALAAARRVERHVSLHAGSVRRGKRRGSHSFPAEGDLMSRSPPGEVPAGSELTTELSIATRQRNAADRASRRTYAAPGADDFLKEVTNITMHLVRGYS